MRTTLTIDDDVMTRLKQLAARRCVPLRTVVNDVLRTGLDAAESPPASRPYRTRTRSLGHLPGIDPTKLGQVSDELDDLDKMRRS